MQNILIGIALFSVAGTSQASSIRAFTDRPTFDMAVAATTTETFGPNQCFPLTAPLNNSSSYGCLPAGTIQPGATYSAQLSRAFPLVSTLVRHSRRHSSTPFS